jgi:hypothetical protein
VKWESPRVFVSSFVFRPTLSLFSLSLFSPNDPPTNRPFFNKQKNWIRCVSFVINFPPSTRSFLYVLCEPLVPNLCVATQIISSMPQNVYRTPHVCRIFPFTDW